LGIDNEQNQVGATLEILAVSHQLQPFLYMLYSAGFCGGCFRIYLNMFLS
jgi:hypothetical protein